MGKKEIYISQYNNCGGFCVKAGMAQFQALLEEFPDRYKFNEEKELEWQEKTGKKYTVMTRRVDGKKIPMTMREFRERVEAGESFKKEGWGFCNCFIPQQQDLFISGKDGYHTYRIPALITTAEGSLLAFCEGRRNSRSDHGDIDIMLKRSTDGGETWSDQQVVYAEAGRCCFVGDLEY